MHAAISHEFKAEKGETGLNKTITTHDTCREIITLLTIVTQKDNITNDHNVCWHGAQKDNVTR